MNIITKDGRKFVQDDFIYGVNVASLAAAASVTQNISIEADSNFLVVKASYFASIAGAAVTDSTRVIPLVSVSITDSGSGRNLQNIPIQISSLAGNDGLPMVWAIPREFKASSNISVTFTNTSAATTYTNLSLALIGVKQFAM